MNTFPNIVKFSIACLVTLLLLCSPGVIAIENVDEISVRLVGTWKGEGKSLGMESRPEMTWEPTLDGKFIRLVYRNELRSDKAARQVFEGHAYYKSLGGGKYQGSWFDSQGEAHPIQAVFADSALTSVWGTKETKLGKTIYRLLDSKTMELVDYIQTKDGNWKEFSRATLKKQ